MDRRKMAHCLRELLDATPRPANMPEPAGEVIPFAREDLLRYLKTGRIVLISRPMIEAIVDELERGR